MGNDGVGKPPAGQGEACADDAPRDLLGDKRSVLGIGESPTSGANRLPYRSGGGYLVPVSVCPSCCCLPARAGVTQGGCIRWDRDEGPEVVSTSAL